MPCLGYVKKSTDRPLDLHCLGRRYSFSSVTKKQNAPSGFKKTQLPLLKSQEQKEGTTHTPNMQHYLRGFPRGDSGKDSTCQCRGRKGLRFDPWVKKTSWRRKWQSTPVFLPGESHEQRSREVYSPWDRRIGHNYSNKGWADHLSHPPARLLDTPLSSPHKSKK